MPPATPPVTVMKMQAVIILTIPVLMMRSRVLILRILIFRIRETRVRKTRTRKIRIRETRVQRTHTLIKERSNLKQKNQIRMGLNIHRSIKELRSLK